MSESLQTGSTASPPPYVPSGTAASAKMLSSVLGRLVGSYSGPIGRSLHFADRVLGGIVDGAQPSQSREPAQRLYPEPVFGGAERADAEPKPAPESVPPRRDRSAPTRELLTASPERGRAADLKMPSSLRPAMALSSPERMFGPSGTAPGGNLATAGRPVSAATDQQNDQSSAASGVLSEGFSPGRSSDSAESKAGERSRSRPALTLEPLIAAVEAEVSQSQTEEPRSEPVPQPQSSPQLTVKQGGNSQRVRRAAASAITEAQAHKAALEATRQLMEAMRTHAAAHNGDDNRVSLGDMTLIAHADTNKKMAAATINSDSAPTYRPTKKGLSHLPNPKLKEGQQDLNNKIKAMAKLCAEDRKRVEKLAKERFGAHG
jgi:hypothetical protein